MLLVSAERKGFNLEEIKRGTLVYGKHRSWPEGQTGIVTDASWDMIRVQYLPDIQNVLNHFFISAEEAEAGEWEIRYSSDGMENVVCFPDGQQEQGEEEVGEPVENMDPEEPGDHEGADKPEERCDNSDGLK